MEKLQYFRAKKVRYSAIERVIWNYLNHQRGVTSLVGDALLNILAIPALAYKMLEEGLTSKQLASKIKNEIEDLELKDILLTHLERGLDYIEKLTLEVSCQDLYDFTLTYNKNREINRSAVSITLNTEINLLMTKLLKLQEADTFAAFGCGLGDPVILATLEQKVNKYYGVEHVNKNYQICLLRSWLLGVKDKFIHGDMMKQNFKHLEVNKALAYIDLGKKFDIDAMKSQKKLSELVGKFDFKMQDMEWVKVLARIDDLKDEFRFVTILPGRSLFSKTSNEIREYLLKKGLIEAVIELPERSMEGIIIPLYILVISQNNESVKMIDASTYFTAKRKTNILELAALEKLIDEYNKNIETENIKNIPLKTILKENINLTPSRYLNKVKINFSSISLESVCNIRRGANITSRNIEAITADEETPYKLIQLKDINEGNISRDLLSLEELDDNYNKYLVNDGNIIISKNYPFKVAVLKAEENIKYLGTGNLYILDVDTTKYDPYVLAEFLLSDRGWEQLNALKMGTVISMLNLNDLKEIKIPELTKETQEILRDKIDALNNQRKITLKMLDKIEQARGELFEEVL